MRLSQFPPSFLVASGDEAERIAIARWLRARGCDVLEVADAATFHALMVEGTHCKAFVVADLAGCSPLHGIAYARRCGVDTPVLAIVDALDPHIETEAERLDLSLATASGTVAALRWLLQGLGHRASRAA